MVRILIVEDDITLSDGIALALRQPEYGFTQCHELASAYEAIKNETYQLVILDINLPDGSGYEFLKKLRQKEQTPVLVLTANDLEMDEVMGFELGADDYVTKPFSLAVLRVRIASLLKRTAGRSTVYVCDDMQFDFDNVRFFKGSGELQLSVTEQKLLRLLTENQGNTLQRATLIDRVWSDGAKYVDENALSVAIRRLRKKIGDDPVSPRYIHTVYGTGYVWRKE